MRFVVFSVGRFVVFSVGRFVVFSLYLFGTVLLLEDLLFFVGTVYCCKICSYLLGDLKLIYVLVELEK